MKILSVNGYYDLATPFHGAEYEFSTWRWSRSCTEHPLHLLSGGSHDVHGPGFGAAAEGGSRRLLREHDVAKERAGKVSSAGPRPLGG